MIKEITQEELKRINDYLRENGMYVYAYESGHRFVPVVEIYIEHGDWKHEHLRTDWLMENLGYTKYRQEITFEDGSDCYSAIHYYADTQLVKDLRTVFED